MMLSFRLDTARITRDLPSVKLQKIVYTTQKNRAAFSRIAERNKD
jgi:hypothetical protein